ncbi:hypothetical protein SAMN02746095_02919 [Acidocella aminolytica 101 = DSM 11237]|nr:hypothetical protein SAMN02746095_02919 [Acidocella aminolytica 101 = DSM 11237]
MTCKHIVVSMESAAVHSDTPKRETLNFCIIVVTALANIFYRTKKIAIRVHN